MTHQISKYVEQNYTNEAISTDFYRRTLRFPLRDFAHYFFSFLFPFIKFALQIHKKIIPLQFCSVRTASHSKTVTLHSV